MAPKPKVYIAGVGYSQSSGVAALVSAATKALLDAGITYDDVIHGVKSKKLQHGSEAFKAFDNQGGIVVKQAEDGSELDTAIKLVRDEGSPCVLVITVEKSSAFAFILLSHAGLSRRAYVKDSSAQIHEAVTSSQTQSKSNLHDICQMVWTLRGWSTTKAQAGEESLTYRGRTSQTYQLSRADGGSVPEWKDVEHKQDGKYRLGYNPANETKEISWEDFDAVKAYTNKQAKNQFKRKGGDRAALAKL